MRIARSMFALLVGMAFVACATPPRAASPLDVVIVRHAEKLADAGPDPALSDAGRARAQHLADLLRDSPLVAAYATDTQRARQTAAPSASAHGLSVTPYDPRVPPAEFIAHMRELHPAGTVLIVGHSNTAPAIAAALCRCDVAAMNETEFDRLMRVRFDANGNARLSVERY